MKASSTSRVEVAEQTSRLADLAALVKFRLSITVVLSSVLAYLVALSGTGVSWWAVAVLTAGGFLTTAAANILNEILEKDYDRQMERTRRRPLAEGRMSTSEALLLAGFSSLGGIALLALFNPWTAVLGMVSLMSYAFVYTPLKRVGPVAVAVGAVPGALPALIGCAAAEGSITTLGITLFTLQFFWQLPHFYAIGFLGARDYRKAGFRLVPERDGEVDARQLGRDAVLAAAALIPLGVIPYLLGITSAGAAGFVVVCGAAFCYYAVQFYRRPERSTALRMMFFSFAYLPLVFTAYWAGKFFM
ncbi:heme o synthase [Lewinella sp. IMCC34183]|uniref:heme o synthase n=1 Tax=Lewinella sp. IMCC34183 TaxID=2248762 RepID=UPI000E26BB07|nr:heme o synthase [Lewinella sp. IMCC34183]